MLSLGPIAGLYRALVSIRWLLAAAAALQCIEAERTLFWSLASKAPIHS